MRTGTDLTVSLLLAIFVAATVVLIGTLPALYVVDRQAIAAARSATATLCARDLAAVPAAQWDRASATLAARYGVRVVVLPRGAVASRDANSEYRTLGTNMIEVRFADRLEGARRTFRFALVTGGIALVIGMGLLIRNLVTLLRTGPERTPQSESLQFSTFEGSIRDLKGRESELRRLHAVEKERANELAALTATLVRNLTSGFIAVDEHGLVVDANEAARELLRIDDVAAIARQPIESALGDSAFGRTLRHAATTRTALQREEITDERNGRIIGMSTVPLVDEQNGYFGMFALFTDLTPVRRLELQLREMQSLADLGEMSAGIAHEFRNSLATITGYLRLARRSAGAQQEIDGRLHRAEEETRLLTSAVESLLSFARPFTIQKQTVNLPRLMRDVAGHLEPLAPVDVQFRGDEFDIEGDPALLRRAFENILRNAAEAIAAAGTAGTIVVESRSTPERRMSVADNGVGVDPADSARLFLPFRSNKPNGFGLGLALTKKIIVLHGGIIHLTGKPGSGATVEIEFPAPA
ncbi:MAG TPA: ATP-binding protein [Thermoanaerobaculia bacterium]|nr:ATP-binding protein [Thermoanaerobaculia bacterium]